MIILQLEVLSEISETIEKKNLNITEKFNELRIGFTAK